MKALGFGYISKEQHAQLAAGSRATNVMVVRERNDGRSVRVALVEVPPSLLDTAWEALTKEEREALVPPYMSPQVPTLGELEVMAKHLKLSAAELDAAADKLLTAAAAASPFCGEPSTTL